LILLRMCNGVDHYGDYSGDTKSFEQKHSIVAENEESERGREREAETNETPTL